MRKPRRTTKPFDKRMVIRCNQGVLAGLLQIQGTESQTRAIVGSVPEFIANVPFPDHQNAVSLVASKRRYLLYQELITPTSAASVPHPSQR